MGGTNNVFFFKLTYLLTNIYGRKIERAQKGSQQPTFNFSHDIIAEWLRVNERFNF